MTESFGFLGKNDPGSQKGLELTIVGGTYNKPDTPLSADQVLLHVNSSYLLYLEKSDASLIPLASSLYATFKDTIFKITDDADTSKAFQFQASGITAGQTRVYTVPDYNATLATLAGTETLTNKTLTTPTIASFVNATHDHQSAAGGGQLTDAALSAAVTVAKGGTGLATLTAHAALIGNGTGNVLFLAPSAARNVMISDGTDWASRALVDADIPDALTISGGTVNNSVIGGTTPAAITGTTITATTKFVGPIIQPAADAVAGVQITNAAGSTVYMNWDTTNGFIGIGSGMTAPQAGVHLGPNGALTQLDGYLVTPWISIAEYTNFLLQSNVFTNAAWTKTGVTAAVTATGPLGDANGATNITAGGLSTDGLSQAITNSTTGFWTFNVWLKAQSGTCNVDLNIVSDGETPTKKTVALTTTWKRYFVTQNLTVAHTTKTVSIANGTNAIACWLSALDNNAVMRGEVSTGAAGITSVARTIQVFAPFTINAALTVGAATSLTGGKTTFFTSTTSAASFVVPAGAAPSSPVEGDHWNDSTQKAAMAFIDGIKQARVGALFTMNASATVASTASETTLVTTGVGTMTLPANFAVVGKTIRIRAWGFYSTTGTPTLQIRVKLGTVAVLDTTAKTTASGVSNALWYLNCDITVRATGASGTVFAQGAVTHNAGTAWDMGTTAVSGAIDLTATKLIDVMATWSASSSSNTITCSNLSVEVLN